MTAIAARRSNGVRFFHGLSRSRNSFKVLLVTTFSMRTD